MISIAVTETAFEAVVATLPFGNVVIYEPELNARRERLIWIEDMWVNKLRAMRGLGETYSDVILRLVELQARDAVVVEASEVEKTAPPRTRRLQQGAGVPK